MYCGYFLCIFTKVFRIRSRNGKLSERKSVKYQKCKHGHVSEKSIYRYKECQGCPYKNNKTLSVSKEFERYGREDFVLKSGS